MSETMTVAPDLVALVRRRYHGNGWTPRKVARWTGLDVREVERLVGVPEVLPEGQGRRPRRVAPVEVAERSPQPFTKSGCGCTEKKLCAEHKARLERARRRA